MTDSSWRTVEIGELCEAIFDGPHATPKKTATGPIFLGISNLANGRLDVSNTEHLSPEDFARWTRRATPQADDVVFSYETRLGEAARIPRGFVCCLGRRMALMRPNRNKVDPRFLLYAYLGPDFQETIRTRTIHGSTVDRIPLVEFPSFPIRIPPLSEQRAIARILGALDDKVELNRRMNETLRETAWTVFASGYFGNPERDRWAVEPLRNHVEAVRGLSYTGAGLATDGIPLHNLDSIYEGGGYKREGIKWYLGGHKDRHLSRRGDVVVANTEQGFQHLLIAYPAMIPRRFGEIGLFSHHLYRVRPREDSPLSSTFIYLMLLRGRLHTEIAGYANGTTVNMLPPDALQRPSVAVPPVEFVRDVEALVTPLFERAEATEDESEKLAAIRDALLPKLISGEIRVRETEEFAEAAT